MITRRALMAALPLAYGAAAAIRPASPHAQLRRLVAEYEAALVEERKVQARYPKPSGPGETNPTLLFRDEQSPAQIAYNRACCEFEDGPLAEVQNVVFATWGAMREAVKALGGVGLICDGEFYPVMTVEEIEDCFRPTGGLKARQIIDLDAGKGGRS